MTRKLDAAIARLLGYKVEMQVIDVKPSNYLIISYLIIGKAEGSRDVPHYSKDGNHMLELEREMWERGFVLWVSTHTSEENPDCKVVAEYVKPKEFDYAPEMYVHADTEPIARALAAYRALTGKEWTE